MVTGLNNQITNLNTTTNSLKTNKADTTYVNTELDKKQGALQDSSGTLEYKSTAGGGALLRATNVL